jgi:hypothetical protein
LLEAVSCCERRQCPAKWNIAADCNGIAKPGDVPAVLSELLNDFPDIAKVRHLESFSETRNGDGLIGQSEQPKIGARHDVLSCHIAGDARLALVRRCKIVLY